MRCRAALPFLGAPTSNARSTGGVRVMRSLAMRTPGAEDWNNAAI